MMKPHLASVLVLAAAAPPAGALTDAQERAVREAAVAMSNECVAVERRDEFVSRFHGAFAPALTPIFEEHLDKIRRSQESAERARGEYRDCLQVARSNDANPKEACAAAHEYFLERESTVRALGSVEARQRLTRQAARIVFPAIRQIALDFPACDFPRLLRKYPPRP